MANKDISFLENEYMHFLIMNFYIGENSLTLYDEVYFYQPKNKITLFSEVNSEKIDIESINLTSCKELYTAFKDSKIIKQLDLVISNKNISISFSIKSSPLRITGINAPKSLAEETDDKIIERLLYFDCVKQFFTSTFLSFLNLRLSNDWNQLLRNFNDYIEKF